MEAEWLRPKHSLEVWEQTGDQEPGQRAVGREPTHMPGRALAWLLVWECQALASPGRSEVPSSSTARMHLQYGLPSPSSAS